VTVRGNARDIIFHAPEDYRRFLSQLASALERDQVILYAYVLMPNHAHLVVETPMGNISRFMQRLNTAYGMYRRYKRHRPGHCFQARYGAKVVAGDEYILRVTRYVHLNPVKIKAMARASAAEKLARLDAYPWSSYGAYVGKGEPEVAVDTRWLGLLRRRTVRGRQVAYRAYVESFVDGEDPVLKEAELASRYAVGDGEFRGQIDEELREVRVKKGVYGDIVWPVGRTRELAEVLELVAVEFGVRVEALQEHGRRAGVAKQVAAELGAQYCGVSERDVGRALGYQGNGSVGKQRACLREKLAGDPDLRRCLAALRKRLGDG
jgi:REP element-mobilizing transposase RayT